MSFLQTLFPHSNLQPVSLPSDSHFTFILKSLVMLTITFQVCFCIYIPVFYIFYFGTRLGKCQSWCSRYMLPVFSKMVFLSRLCLCFRLFGTLPHLLSCIEIGHEWWNLLSSSRSGYKYRPVVSWCCATLFFHPLQQSPEILLCVLHNILPVSVCKTDKHELVTVIVDFKLWEGQVAKEIKDLLSSILSYLACF